MVDKFAFPSGDTRGVQPGFGMTLRDWFAGQALKGLLVGQYSDTSPGNLHEALTEAYKIADAMLVAQKEVVHG